MLRNKSIQNKFIILIVSAILSLSILLGGIALLSVNRLLKNDSALMMNAVCTEQALRLDAQLQKIEQAVTAIYDYAYDDLTDVSDLKNIHYRDSYIKQLDKMALDMAKKIDGARTVYFRFNTDISENVPGFFWVKKTENSAFARTKTTDINRYDEDDTEHVGWYYQPQEAKHAIWMQPYYNKNVDIEMVSYIIPFYKDGEFIGVIGMDIDFTMFIDLAQQAAVYKDGKANLIDLDSKTVYYRRENDDDVTIRYHEISDELYNTVKANTSSGSSLSKYTLDGEKYMLAYQTLENGMKYITFAPVNQINSDRNKMVAMLLVVTVGIMIVSILFTVYEARKIVRPLSSLTEAAKRIAAGEWDVDIECNTRDEIGVLTNSITTMAGKLKQYVAEVNRIAYKDGLTGVKNKTCYNDYVSALNLDWKEKKSEYAIVVFDVNNLKIINDNYGHETGDALLIGASSYICRTFVHSPIFRIGGDEFVAILKGDDYENRKGLLNRFENSMKSNCMSVEPYEPIMIAFGMAEYGAEYTDYDDVFRHADRNMYEKKHSMKNK